MKNFITIVTIALIFNSCCSDYDTHPVPNTEGQGGSLATFSMVGEYLYVVDEQALNVFSIATLDSPILEMSIEVGFNIETLFHQNGYLYIGSRNGMFIYGLDDPKQPNRLSEVRHFTACDPVIANDSHAFVTLHSNARCGNNINLLEVYDVSDVTQPDLISSIELISPKGLGLYKNFLLVCDDSIKVFDIRNPAKLEVINFIDQSAFDVIVSGNELLAVGENGIYQYTMQDQNNNLEFSHVSTIDF